MANLTITVDDEVLRRARIRAAELGTSVNAILREYMEQWTSVQEDRRRAVDRILEASRRSRASSGGRTWTRDELYERR